MAYKEPDAGDKKLKPSTTKLSTWPGNYGGYPGPDGVNDPNSVGDPGLYDAGAGADTQLNEWSGNDRRAGGPQALPRTNPRPGDKFVMPGHGELPDV